MMSVYVESKILRSNQKIDRINRISVSKSRCYDRRAHLLAYTKELKHAKELKRPLIKNLRPKSKKRRWAVVGEGFRRLFSQFRRVKRLWKYESIDGEGRWSNGRRKKIHFCKKLKCLLKKISGAWTCNSGATH
ncbi:uncharacterized protein LOC131014326 [Salvia miltiorrhiza]|uniref:uncharacterized protein LOC131014326 n=1 Tax=Salvia miltiorrhiza TaxID=226208 RepID=UPI0025AC7C85|nr:uncharacterized protein LOC131014326 [Salvia miltiorrhiza]